VLTQDFIDTEITPTYADNVVPVDYLITKATYALAPELAAFFNIYYASAEVFYQLATEGGPWANELPDTAKVKVEPGNTMYDLIALGMSSGLMRYECLNGIEYFFLPYYKLDAAFYADVILDDLLTSDIYIARTEETDPWQYDYPVDPLRVLGEFTFREIELNNGLDKMINQVSISNTDPATDINTTIEPLSADSVIAEYGPAKLDASTSYTTTRNPFWLASSDIVDQGEYFQTNILLDQAVPLTTIQLITVDMSKYFTDGYNIPDNGNHMFVQHKLDNGEYIKGYFKIAGIKHQINQSEWFAEIILRPSEYINIINNRPKTPEFTLTNDAGSGPLTTATNFTLSINNYTSEDLANIANIEWMVNFYSDLLNAPSDPGTPPSLVDQRYSYGIPIFNGTTVTWNYDDNGPLEDYANAVDFYGTVMSGPGTYTVYVYITDINGFKSVYGAELISVIGENAYADFTFTKDAQERVTFIDASGPDTNTWTWDFGDGTTYSGKTPPVKQYTVADTYDVSLTVDNGFDTDTITKPVTINIYQIPVQYIKLRYQGTVTRPAGETEYPVDLIDTIGLLEIKNSSFTQTGGIQPFYFGRIGTLEKVQELSKGNGYQWLRILDDPITRANHFEWIYQSSPLSPTDPNIPYSPYGPNYITDYSSGGPLDPMSQTHIPVWTDTPARGTVGGTVPKYRFIPVITDNEDGSQTKSIDIDINFWYSQTYTTGSKTSSSTSVYRNYRNQRPAGASDGSPLGPTAETYLPAGRLASLAYWSQWGSGLTPDYSQSLKVKEINIWPGMDTKVKKTTAKQLLTIPGGGGATSWFFDPPVDPPLDRFGVQTGKTYLPIEIAVSDDGTTFRKIGEAEYVSGNTLTTTYDVSMPPFSSAPILT
jgi:PKD repeat protein